MPDLKRTEEVTEEMLERPVIVRVQDAVPGEKPLRMFPNRFRKRKVTAMAVTHDFRRGPEHILTMSAEWNPFWVEQIRCWCVASDGDPEGNGKSVRQEIEGRIDVGKRVNEVFDANYQADEYELDQPIEHKVFEDLTGE
ncbi:MAG: hypothetical protein KIT79_01000 [Deltaproteobacteria bacterium]|nr:hypothetical protein [Deltaproteobacteria bacterium]